MGWFSALFGLRKAVKDEEGCLACGSPDIEIIGEDAYRCACGHEGGDGLRLVKIRELADRVAAKPVAERRAWLHGEVRDLCQLYAAVPTNAVLLAARERDDQLEDASMHELPVLLRDREDALVQALPRLQRLRFVGRAVSDDLPEVAELLSLLDRLDEGTDSAEAHAHLREAESTLSAVSA